jgi:hypothetical protein
MPQGFVRVFKLEKSDNRKPVELQDGKSVTAYESG